MATFLSYQNNTSMAGCGQQCFCGESSDEEYHHSEPTAPMHFPLLRNRGDDATRQMKPSEDFLASEFSKLSVQERSKALDDLHCVGQDLVDTPELIEESLFQLDRILNERNEPIYQVAKSQNRAYVEDLNLRLRFLRANLHDTEQAANQMIGFLTQKELYFGRDKLTKDITLEDLNEEDQNLLSGGRFHIQDGVDRKGRMVVYFLNHDLHLSNSSLMRVNYFVFFNILSPLPSVQSKGVVVCYYDMSKPEAPVTLPPMHMPIKFTQFMTKIPIRRTGMHICLKANAGSSSLLYHNYIFEKIFRGLRKSVRVRARVHYGSDVELQYKLQSHGLPMENIPINSNGDIRQDILNVWFHRYVAKEWNERLLAIQSPLVGVGEMMDVGEDDAFENWSFLNHQHDGSDGSPTPTSFANNIPCNNEVSQDAQSAPTPSKLAEPTDKDVLLGRGRGIQMHPGNVRFREFLKEYQDEYNNTPRYKRVDTSKELTRLLLEDGVRFLQKAENGDGWVESNVAEAEKKVKQLFRTRKKLKSKTNQ